MSDIAPQNSAQEVVGTSRQTPVPVDFWAPWCGPHRTLSPMLEKLGTEYIDKRKLAEISSDENPELSTQFHAHSIPYVMTFVDGKPVDQFVGMSPEAQLHALLDRVIPQPAEVTYREGLAVNRADETTPAREAPQNALTFDPGSDTTRFALVNLFLDTDGMRATQGEFALFSSKVPQDARYTSLETRLRTAEWADTLPDVGVLHTVVQARPDNPQARLDLVQRYIADQDYEATLEQSPTIIERDRVFHDDTAHKTMASVFDMMRDAPQAVPH